MQPIQYIIETLSHVNATPKLPERVVIANTSIGHPLVGGTRDTANTAIILTYCYSPETLYVRLFIFDASR